MARGADKGAAAGIRHEIRLGHLLCRFGDSRPGSSRRFILSRVWKLSSAVVAPWADPKQKPDSAEQSRLLGKTVTFKAKEITGPRPIACATPHYKISDFTADLLFQG